VNIYYKKELRSSGMNIENVASQFRPECFSPEGRELSVLIETHANEMVRVSEDGRPALTAVLPHLPLRLAAALRERDSLMQAFGHMARLEMRERGFTEKDGIMNYQWPSIRITSELSLFRRT
jgi:hypothetical protein